MRRNAGMLVVLTALSGCAVMRNQNVAERSPAGTRAPSPAAQTAWKQYNMMMSAPANTAATAKSSAAEVAGKNVVPQSPWPIIPTPNKVASQPAAGMTERASGTLVSATYVETPRESASAKNKVDAPVAPKGPKDSAAAAVLVGGATTAGADLSRSAQVSAAPAPLPEILQTGAVLPPPEPPMLTPPPAGTSEVRPVSAITSQAPAAPSVRMVNTKRIQLNYELKDVGESGISAVELWYTQDTRTWKKYEGQAPTQGVYAVDVDGEGLYGFTMVARSGVGYSRELPQAGELPQVWVEVDLTRPTVQVTAAELQSTPKTQNLIVRWNATDKNLTARPITISYAEKADGPWTPIAANLENVGKHDWAIPTSVPKRVYVKVEAADLVGHIGTAQTVESVLIDRSRPTVSILTVGSENKEK